MTSAALRQLLLTAGLPAALWQLPDRSYEPVSLSAVEANWGAWLEARPLELCNTASKGGKLVRTSPRWIEEVSDCDNLALGLVAHAQVGNALAAYHRHTTRGGLALGVVFYVAQQRVQGGHAINWFVDHGGLVQFFEPGNGTRVNLNTQERSSAWFGLAA